MSAPKMTQIWLVGLLLASTVGLLARCTSPSASAQRDNSPPSCCACHAWEDPVVEQGEWHTVHALQINCCACHGGNGHAFDPATAHAGMTPNPLNSPQQSCQHCHPADYQERTTRVDMALGLTPDNYDSTTHQLAAAPTLSIITPWPQITFRGWDWPVELAIAIVAAGIGVMRWRRTHSGTSSRRKGCWR